MLLGGEILKHKLKYLAKHGVALAAWGGHTGALPQGGPRLPTKKAPKAEVGDPSGVADLLAGLAHPKKAEIEAVRAVVLAAAPQLRERVKWKAPSFFLRGKDLAAFNLRHEAYAHRITRFPLGMAACLNSPLFEGQHVDRRELISTAWRTWPPSARS